MYHAHSMERVKAHITLLAVVNICSSDCVAFKMYWQQT